MAVVKNLVAVKGLQVAVNFGEGGSEGLPRSGNPDAAELAGKDLKLRRRWPVVYKASSVDSVTRLIAVQNILGWLPAVYTTDHLH